ncbi:26323_t:CDS:2, partial [Gigaspora margarita]
MSAIQEKQDMDILEPSPQKRVKIAQAATENRQTDDPSQKIYKESREVRETTKTPKNQNNMTSSDISITNNNEIIQTNGDPGLPAKEKQETSESGPAMEIDKQGTNEANSVWSNEDFFDITVQPVLDPDEQQRIDMCETQSNATVEDDNSKSVAQKSY